jgi:hypothetical protein
VSEIRSYRTVFELERRIYRVDRLRLNPGGVPVRGVVYGLAILAGLALARRVPLVGAAVGVLPWYARDLVLPAAGAGLLAMVRVEGRTFHQALSALLRYMCGPRHLTGMRRCGAPGGRWGPGEVLVLPDGSGPRLRRLRYTGPGTVLVGAGHERTEPVRGLGRVVSGARLTLREPPEGDRRRRGARQAIVLARGVRLRVG